MEKGESWLAFIAGLILGGLVGAVAMLLYAPQSGEETRRQIREGALDLQDEFDAYMIRARKRYDEFATEVQAELDKFNERLESRGQEPAVEATPEATKA